MEKIEKMDIKVDFTNILLRYKKIIVLIILFYLINNLTLYSLKYLSLYINESLRENAFLAGLIILISNVIMPLIINKKFLKITFTGIEIKLNKKEIKYSVFAILVSSIYLLLIFSNSENKNDLLNYYKNLPSILIFYYFCVAFGEEFFYRGIMFSLFPKNSNKVVFILFNTLYFVFIHNINQENFLQYLYGTLFFLILRLLSGSIYPGVIYHFIYDLWIVPKDNTFINNFWEVSNYYMPLVIALALILYLFKYKNKESVYLDNNVEIKKNFTCKQSVIMISLFLLLNFTNIFNQMIVIKKNEYTIFLNSSKMKSNLRLFIPQGKNYEIGFEDGRFEYVQLVKVGSSNIIYEYKNDDTGDIYNQTVGNKTTGYNKFEKGWYSLKFKTRSGKNNGKIYIRLNLEDKELISGN